MSNFEIEYKKYAPEWALVRNIDGSFQHRATDAAYKIWNFLNKEITELKNETQRLQYLVGEKIGHPSSRDYLDAEICRQLDEQKRLGQKEFMTDTEIEDLVKSVIRDHDENPNRYWKNLYKQIDDLTKQVSALSNQLLENDCMIDQTWFMKGTPVANLIKHAEGVYKAEAIAQNSKIQFGTDDNKTWWAHEVPFFGTVQLDQIEEDGLIEWDIYFNECWQGPFSSKSKAIQHLEECISEKREEAKEG